MQSNYSIILIIYLPFKLLNMRQIIILFSLLLSFSSSANTEVKNETTDNSVAVKSFIIYDKRKRARRKWKRKHGAPNSNCTKRIRVRV